MKTIGDETLFGKIIGIGFIGERYYFIMNEDSISIMPASLIEEK